MVFVTGANGLLGSCLVKLLLAKGEQVRALRRKTSDLSLLGDCVQRIEWVAGDVLDITSLEEAMKGVEEVYHCAAHISFIASEIDYMMQVNITGTANVMNAALHAGVRKVVHVSSEAALGFPHQRQVIDENYADPQIRQCPPYYQSKHYGEREAWRAYAEGLEVVIVCPAYIIGGGWWSHLTNRMFEKIDRGLWFYPTSYNGYVDVRDVAECMMQLMKSNIKGEKYLLVSENANYRDVLWMVADAMNRHRPFISVGKFIPSVSWPVERIGSLFTGRAPALTRQSARLLGVDFKYSNRKIKEDLDYSFIPLKQSIEDTVRLYLQSKAEGKNCGVVS